MQGKSLQCAKTPPRSPGAVRPKGARGAANNNDNNKCAYVITKMIIIIIIIIIIILIITITILIIITIIIVIRGRGCGWAPVPALPSPPGDIIIHILVALA